MATLSERLTKRFRGVPGVESTDIADWIAEAEAESGHTAGTTADNALLYLALSIGCSVIATDAARFFRYTDGEETVDKTGVFDKYTKLARDARRQYNVQIRGGYGAFASHPARADGR